MAICIYFESYFRQEPYENTFKPENGQEWTVEEKWSVTPIVIQEITLVNEDEYFESYYYVDLEIVSAFRENDAKIFKSERMASNNIKFLIKGNEFSCFRTYYGMVYLKRENYAQVHMHRYKITLTPILQFCDEIFRKPGKRTKIDLLGGLKTLSNDIGSMKGKLFSDIIIYCGNERVRAHRNIFAARSTVFKKFLQGVEDEEVQSCLEIEPIDETDANTITDSLGGGGDNSTNNANDAAAVHTEGDNEVQIILSIESEMNTDEVTNNDKGSRTIHAKKDEVRNEMKQKSTDDATEDDKNCTTINSEKNEVQEIKQSSLKIEPVINEKDVNSIKDGLGSGDNFTNNDSDAAVMHIEGNNKVKIILNTGSDEAVNGDKGSATIHAKHDEVRKEIKQKGTDDDATEDDKDSEKNGVEEIKPKIDDVATADDFGNHGNDTTVLCPKKGHEVQYYLRVKSEIKDYFFEEDNYTNDKDDSANANGTLVMHQEKDNEIQNKLNSKQKSFEKESEIAFNANASTSAMPSEEGEEIQHAIELESEYESDDGNDIFDQVQDDVEIQEYASNKSEVFPPTIEENELQNELDSGEPDDASTVSSDNNILKVRLKKVHSSIFHDFIDFIYSGQYKTSGIKKTKDLLIAARDYGICDLEKKCIMDLRSQTSIETSDDIYDFASVYKFEDLQICVLDYLKNKIIGKKRRINHIIRMIEQPGIYDVEDEEGMTTFEKIRWLKVMRSHPTYFKDILNFEKGKKIRGVILRFFPETSIDDVIADCRERLTHILNVRA